MKEVPRITVGELRQQFANFPDDWTVDFSGLEFYRVKPRGPTHVQIEFNQSVYLSAEGLVVVENHEQ